VGAAEIQTGEVVMAEQQGSFQEVFQAVVSDLAQGKKKTDVVRALAEEGWPDEEAIQLVDYAGKAFSEYKDSPEGRRVLAHRYSRHMLYGLLWTIGGTLVTAITYGSAVSGSGSGHYLIAWGAILFGIIDFFRGFCGWLRYGSMDFFGGLRLWLKYSRGA
jgi:hypothetical protein